MANDDGKNQAYFPNGWVVKTYKHMNIPKTDFDETQKVFKEIKKSFNGEHPYKDITYGTYDRIKMVPVDGFSDFIQESNKAYDWYGMSQTILLFPLEKNENKRHFLWRKNESKAKERVCLRDSETSEVRALDGFYGTSFCYISDEIRNLVSEYDDLMNHCNEVVLQLVDAYNKSIVDSGESGLHGKVTAEVFGSLSAAELIIVWSAKQYTDILYLMDCVRDFYIEDKIKESGNNRYSLFRTTYTMISFFDIMESDSNATYPLGDILGHAHIQFVMQDGVGESRIEEFEQYLLKSLENSGKYIEGNQSNADMSSKLYRCAGEYDLIASVESKYIPRLFNKPGDWDENGWNFDPQNRNSDSFSLHHPIYNEFVLYSFTRLGYGEEDLPLFAREKNEDKTSWKTKRESIPKDVLGEMSGSFRELGLPRSALIRDIEKVHKARFDSLIQLIMKNVPATSNLINELNQLFSDFVQCCSSNADYVWVEDYKELFLHVLERVRDSVWLIEVWKYYEKASSANHEKDPQWNDSRERLEHIRELLKSLHQHTNHISASNKLFFREQKTHFGYTALHDLVIHAYYDIIKRLINYVYSYTDKTIQSQLYPLVDFTADDRITSRIYSEESADDFLRLYDPSAALQIPSRIMVIQIPIDGMDNLMHYLPMLIHEVYHYAAPKNRIHRNRILAQVTVYQVLRFGFGMIFINEKNDYFARSGDERVRAHKDFQRFLDPILYEAIEENGDAIYTGIVEDFISECDPIRDSISETMFLRSWFLIWMQNWLNDCDKRDGKTHEHDPNKNIHYNFSDLNRVISGTVADELGKYIETQKKSIADMDREGYGAQYCKLLIALHKKMKKAIKKWDSSGDTQLANNDFFQILLNRSYDFITKRSDIYKLLEQFDEIFPDMAMVVYTQMPASGYMLQIALDLDKQLQNGKEFETDQVRFVSVLNFLLRGNADDKQDINEQFNDELKSFTKMYTSSYRIASGEKNFDKEKTKMRAERWCSTFKYMFEHQYEQSGMETFHDIYKYVNILIADMKDCLTFENEETKNDKKMLFADPYQKYLGILKDDNVDRQKSDLFKLSIDMIQKFQNFPTLERINADFVKKPPVNKMGIVSNGIKSNPFYQYRQEKVIISPDSYFTEVRDALKILYGYREKESISESAGMWFRGVASIDYPIVPSGFVHYAEDASRLQIGFPRIPCSYAKVQLHNYESFRYSAEGTSPGINPANYYQTINYLALMQHYQQHSNLVDWSEDYFGSSYFALEDEINANDLYEYQRGDEKNYHYKDVDAVMYILDPVRFNKACEEIEEKLGISSKDPNVKIDVFNLSIRENQEIHSTFHDFTKVVSSGTTFESVKATNPKFKKNKITLRYLIENDISFVKKHVKLPRAVYVAKLNDRIRAQSGLFVIYDLESVPVVWEGEQVPTNNPNTDLFHYQSLESIQDYYLTLPDKRPFLIKIKIPKNIKKELGRMLYECGISKEKIYPELSNYRHR